MTDIASDVPSRSAGGVINARVLVSFLAAHEGGRVNDVCQTYRPVHNFEGPDNRELWFGEILLGAIERIRPGETREVTVQFRDEPALLAKLHIGRVWQVQEGKQVVATATLLEILDRT